MDDLSRIERMYGSVNEYNRQQEEYEGDNELYIDYDDYEPDPEADEIRKCKICGEKKLKKDGWIDIFTCEWYCSEECCDKNSRL